MIQSVQYPRSSLKLLNSVHQPFTPAKTPLRKASSLYRKDCSQILKRSQSSRVLAASEEEEDEAAINKPLLEPEEDWTIPGGYQDSLSKNTKLGKALDEACSELSHLGELEKDSLLKASELLRKLGYKVDVENPQTQSDLKEE